jgi:CDGSH-type Zn-finger protein
MINPQKHPDRHTEAIPAGKRVAFCRCWQSSKFPYCDGAHRKVNAEADDNVGPVVVSVASEEESSGSN